MHEVRVRVISKRHVRFLMRLMALAHTINMYIYIYMFVLALSDRMTLLFPGGQGKLHLAFLWQQYSASAKTQLLGWFGCFEIVHGGSSHDLEVVEIIIVIVFVH